MLVYNRNLFLTFDNESSLFYSLKPGSMDQFTFLSTDKKDLISPHPPNIICFLSLIKVDVTGMR